MIIKNKFIKGDWIVSIHQVLKNNQLWIALKKLGYWKEEEYRKTFQLRAIL